MSPSPRLASGLWVRALLRRCDLAAAHAAVLHKGDETAGVVLVRVVRSGAAAHIRPEEESDDDSNDGDVVYVPVIAEGGERRWCRAGGDPDAYIARRRDSDPDLWVVEITDPRGAALLGEPVDSGDDPALAAAADVFRRVFR